MEKVDGWKTLRVVAGDYEYLEQRAKDQSLSIAACLHQTIKREPSVGALRTMIEQLAEHVRVLDQFTQRSASDITTRLRRMEADRSAHTEPYHTRTFTAHGVAFEDYDRYPWVRSYPRVLRSTRIEPTRRGVSSALAA